MNCLRWLSGFRLSAILLGLALALPAHAQPARVIVKKDVVYGSVHGAGLLADIAYPEGKGPFPVILSVHGGRWVASHRSDPGEGAIDVKQWAGFGFFAMSIDYRLVGCTPPPACYQDVQCAIRWIHAHKDQYPLDADRLFLIGMSAGAHLVSLAATLGDGPFPRTGGWEKYSNDIRGVISLSGPYDLEKLSWGNLWKPATGDPMAARRLASPIRHVTARTKPMLILHSDNDGSVPVQQAMDMAEVLEKAKARHRLSIYKQKGHMRVTEEAIKETRAFIEEMSKDAATELGKLAAPLKPGTWAELHTRGYTAGLLKVQNHHILEYTGAAAWDPTARQVLFVGQGHYSALKFIRYDAAANDWKLQETPPWWKGDAQTGKGPIGHAYYNNTIDPTRGIFYLHQSATRLVHAYDTAREQWKTLPEIPEAAAGHGTAIAYFPERKGLVRVLGGTVHFFSEEKNDWARLGEKLAMGPYHNVAQYSAVHKVVLFGGGNGSKDLYKLDAEGKITRLKSAPVEIGINTAVVTSDPVSGELLVLHRDDRFFSFDAARDTWKELDKGEMPLQMKGSSFDVVATPVSNYGVTLFFTAERKGLKVYLYKHTNTNPQK